MSSSLSSGLVSGDVYRCAFFLGRGGLKRRIAALLCYALLCSG